MNTEYIKNTIIRLCITPKDFSYLSKHSSGLDPIVLKQYLIEMVNAKQIKFSNGQWVIKSYRFSSQTQKKIFKPADHSDLLSHLIPYYKIFKKPHPLDYEWRNSLKTLNYLSEFVLSQTQRNDKVLLLGMPSLFISSYYKKLPQYFTLIDMNKPLLDDIKKIVRGNKKFSIFNLDIFSLLPENLNKFHAVFIDPPWYPHHYFHFMWVAAQTLQIGGFLAVSFPPLNTRPSVAAEKIEWITFCQKQGLYLESLHSNRLEYIMPFFEFNAIRAAGIYDILPFWRQGDFAIFRKISHNYNNRPLNTRKHDLWTEVEVGTVRFRVNEFESDHPDKPAIEHLVKGDILPTVSSRDERRQHANVWTSGNRIYKVGKPTQFVEIAKAFKKSEPSTSKDFKIVSELINFVTEIEKKEYENYTDWIQYEMERPIIKET